MKQLFLIINCYASHFASKKSNTALQSAILRHGLDKFYFVYTNILLIIVK